MLLIIFAIGYYILHSESGHKRFSSYLSSTLSQEVGREVQVEVQDISLSLSHLDARLLIEEKVLATIEGFVSLAGNYDISYHLSGNAQDFVDVNGTFEGNQKVYTLQAKGQALDGDIALAWHHDKGEYRDIMIDLNKVSSAKLAQILDEKPLIAGQVTVKVDIPLYLEYKKKGTIMIEQERAGIYLKNIKSRYGIDFPKDFMVAGLGQITLDEGKHRFDVDINTTVGKLKLSEGRFLEVNKAIDTAYILDISDLGKLAFLSGKKYAGSFKTQGHLTYHDKLAFEGDSDSLSGAMHYTFKQNNFHATIKDAALSKIFHAMHYPAIMRGVVQGRVSYDAQDKVTLINLESKNAHIPESTATRKIAITSGLDLSKELFTNTFFASSIESGVVSYDFKAANKGGYISLDHATMDANKNSINTEFDVNIQNLELSGTITGSLQSPKVNLDIAKFIEYKAKKEIDEFFGIGTTQRVKKKLKSVDKEKVKSFFNGLF